MKSPSMPWLHVILAAPLVLLLTEVEVAPSAVDGLDVVPHPEEIRLLEEVAAWSGESPAADPFDEAGLVPFPEDGSLLSSVRSRSESFALFTDLPVSAPGRRLVLEDLPYGEQIERAAENNDVDALLVAAMVEAESSFRPTARSSKGAVGLMQVLPETARELGFADATDPSRNLEAGARYLARLLDRFDGDLTLALAAYNAGPGKVLAYNDVPPYRETRRYVEKVLRRYVSHRQLAWRQDHTALEAGQAESASDLALQD